MRVTRIFAAATLGLACNLALAADPDQVIRQTFQVLQPDLPIEGIAESPLAGIYQVSLKGGRMLYASADGQFILQGSLYRVSRCAMSLFPVRAWALTVTTAWSVSGVQATVRRR